MRIALSQINTTQGDIPGNLTRMTAAIREAADRGVDLLVFPELALVGYCPRDLLFLRSFQREVERATEALLSQSPEDMAILFGTVRAPQSPQGLRLLNSACLIQGGSIQYVADKRHLPNYDVFDEARYFLPGRGGDVFKVRDIPCGVTICEDIWGGSGGDPGMPRYVGDPAGELVEQGARLLFNLSASPFHLGKRRVRRELVQSLTRRLGVPLALCNLVGGNDEVIFDGTSLYCDGRGQLVARGRSFEEDLLIVEHEALGEASRSFRESSCEEESLRQALVLGIRDYARKSGFERVVLGLSGGIDSALTAALAAEAMGPEQVWGIGMPSRYSAAMSEDDARLLADNLGIRFEVIPIGDLHDLCLKNLEPLFEGRPSDVAEENIQPRLRGLYLMALSNKHRALLLSTGNKSELAVGYCTLYGDMCGGLAVLADLPKGRVYALSRHINERAARPVIPKRTLTRPPSAELRPDQKDSDSLPDYDVLDEILRLAVEEGKDLDEITAAGFERDTVRDVLRRLWRNEFKRKQMPPGLKVTAKAFGMGRRMPLTGGMPKIQDPN